MNELPKRKNIRLKDYDYSQPGCYFVTICTQDKRCILWDVNAQLSNIGVIIKKQLIVFHQYMRILRLIVMLLCQTIYI